MTARRQEIISISNQKGGVGKTTMAINLAYQLSALRQKVLLVDFDPQSNSSSGLGVRVESEDSVYAVISSGAAASEKIVELPYENFHLLPGHQDLSGAQIELIHHESRHAILQKALSSVAANYDYIFIDTPPSLGLLTLNALCAAKSVLVPIQCEYFALEGISQLLLTIKQVKEQYNKALFLKGVILTMFDSRVRLSHEVMQNVVDHFGEKTYRSIISRNTKIAESSSHGVPVGVYDPSGIGSKTFYSLAQEFLKKDRQKQAVTH